MKNAEETYAHAFQSCVDPKDDGYLRRLIADAPNIKEPFVAVRGFANYDFVIPLHEPMSFGEASEKFKEMNSNTVQFWVVHKPSEQADDLAIFPFYYDRTGQNNGEYHDLRSFIEMKLHNAQQGLNESNGRYSGYAHTPDQEAVDRGYSALASVDTFNLSAEGKPIPSKVFPVRIQWLDNKSELDVYIAESHGIGDLPDGFTDENIFFYGMSENSILRAVASGEPCENEWVITELYR